MPAWLDALTRRDPTARTGTPASRDVAACIAEGNRLLDAGRLADAAACYMEALGRDPSSVAAAVNLGYTRRELGEVDSAAAALEHALAREPDNVDALFMVGLIALERGATALAAAQFTAVVEAQPSFTAAYAPLCRARVALDRHDLAVAAVDAGLAADPRQPELQFLRGNLLRVAGDVGGAIAAYTDALALEPGLVEARIALGALLVHAGRGDEARAAFEQAIKAPPREADACVQVGDGLLGLGMLDAACHAFQLALERDPAHAGALQNLSALEQMRGGAEAARAAAQRLTEVAPKRAEGWINLGTALDSLGRRDEAEYCFRTAVELSPTDARPSAALAFQALQRGETTEAITTFTRAVARDPKNLAVRSQQLFALTYLDDPLRYLDAARAYGRLTSGAAAPFSDWPAEAVDAAPLRVGLVSGDLRAHPVGFFIESVLPHVLGLGIDLVAFPTSVHDDMLTARLKPRCAGWVPLLGMDDATAAARIRAERIHVLLDLSGHTGHNRLPLFARRPAPVQASWLGYWASTGVRTIDYIIADPFSVPDGWDELYTERIWRLPETRLCFTPPVEGAAVGPLPALARGNVTFGCFQNLNKIGDEVLAAWRRVLNAVPDSRLRLQNLQTGASGVERVRQRFIAAGLSTDRIVLAPPVGREAYLAAYQEVDLLLDTFPFAGGTTTCEALWMGVPTVTQIGRTMAGSQGRLMMGCTGLADWVAANADGYVELAVRHASDLEALARLRAGLRDRALASPLFDARRFAAHFAVALHEMWARR